MTISKIIFLLTSPFLWSLVPSIMLFICTLCVMNGSKYLPKSLPPGIDVISVTAGATIFSVYTGYEGSVIGEIPVTSSSSSFLPFEILDYKSLLLETPIVERCFNGSFVYLLFSATIFASISFLSIVGVAFAFEAENNIKWSPTRELAAQGIANCVAGLTGVSFFIFD